MSFKADDIVFGRVLRDPLSRVDFAVGTTYSLDLDTFISLPFSLGFLEEPDEVMLRSTTYIFSALKLCSDNLAVFCNFSDIKVPPGARKVYYALMEESVFPVNAEKGRDLVNFHPKVWVIRQTGPDGTFVRVIVMSRNLTRDGLLDCACVLTGKVRPGKPASAKKQAKHKPLCDFLKYLSGKAKGSSKKQTRIKHLIDDIYTIEEFDTEGSQYDDYDFLPMGIPGYSGKEALEQMSKAFRIAVVSPFLDDKVMGRLGAVRDRMLLSSEFSITQGTVDAFGRENIYTMNPQMTSGDTGECVDLHAKMYFTSTYQKDRNTRENHLFLGSTNATMGGFDRNVEFLVRMRFAPSVMSWAIFCDYFKNDPDKRFCLMAGVPDKATDKLLEYRRTQDLRKAIASIQGAKIEPEGEGLYRVTLSVSEDCPKALFAPLMRPDLKTGPFSGLSFTGLALTDLSEFYTIEYEDVSRVIKVDTEGMPPGRDEALCRKAIPRSEFYDCISFLLSESKTAYVLEHEALKRDLQGKTDQLDGTVFAAVYENLLRRAYESPESVADIKAFVESLPGDVVPEEFRALFQSITAATKSFRR